MVKTWTSTVQQTLVNHGEVHERFINHVGVKIMVSTNEKIHDQFSSH